MTEKINHYLTRIKEGKLKEIKKELVWISSYGKKHFFAIALYTLVGMSSVLLGLFSSITSKDLVDIITGHNTGELLKTFILIIVLQLVSLFVTQVSSFISSLVSTNVSNSIKADMYDKIMATEWEQLTIFHSGELSSRWSGDSSIVANGMLTLIPNLVQVIFRVISSLILVMKYDPSFAIFALIGAPLSMIISRKNLAKMSKISMSSLSINTKLAAFTSEAFSNFQFVKAFNLSPLYSRKLRELQNEQVSININQQKNSATNAIIMAIMASVVTYSTYGWGIYKVWSGAITYGTMTMFLTLSGSLSVSLQSLSSVFPSAIAISNSTKRLMALSELPKEDLSMVNEVSDFAANHKEDGVGLKIANSSYTYMNGTEVFKNIDFEAHPNEVVALVGPSGQGKTTMLRLLLSLVKSSEGDGCLISGNCNDSMPLTASCRQLFSYVPQGNTMFTGTIAENMRFIKEDATDEEIIEALKLACAWEFVEKLPDGINTVIRERGLGFSEGQAQRLSIARALIRKSPILLLDEATSALDVYTEKELLNNILNDDYPRTTIVTAHRLTVLRACNRVYKIHDKTCTLMSDEEVQELMNM